MQADSPTKDTSHKNLDKKKKELEILEGERKKFYITKSELKSIKERLQDKENLLKNYKRDSEFYMNQLDSISKELFDKKTTKEKLSEEKNTLEKKERLIEELNKKERELEKLIHTNEHEIKKLLSLKENVSKMDVCPLCKNKITQEHIKSISNETKPQLENLTKSIDESTKQLEEISDKRNKLQEEIKQIISDISKRESDIIKLQNIEEKRQQIKSINEKIEEIQKELISLKKRKKTLEDNFDENSNIEHKCEMLRMEVQEISIRNKKNIDSDISFKQKEVERSKINLKQFSRNEEDLKEDLEGIRKDYEEKERVLEEKREQEEELSKKFKKLISERDDLQMKMHHNELEISNRQNLIHNVEQIINNLKITKAKFDAEQENLEIEMLGFQGIEIIKMNREALVQRLQKDQEILSKIGVSVNLRSLEVYDSVKKEYDAVKERADLINKEKEGITKIIHEIDIKKKKTFNKTLDQLNELFSRNFAQLSTKGHVSLDVENRKDPFEGGIGIIVKTGHGKYFDVTSLSGGEQTLVALSLIFAIQEYKPYCFYILDEIDAALDKRNSERLGGLLKKYMKRGQYIVITHNDEIITNASALYGVSMHEGISKITSLKI